MRKKKIQTGLKKSENNQAVSKEVARKRLFVDKIKESRKQAKEGKVTIVKPEELWK